MTLLLNLLKIFNLNLSPGNSALSALLGFSLGILPLLSPIVWFILALGLILRLNAAYLALFWLVGELVGFLLNQPLSALGEHFLNAQLLQDLWQQWYNQTLWRFLNFNHTYVMGSSIALIILALPLWVLFYFLIKQYQKALLSPKLRGFVSLPVIRSLFNVNASGEGKKIGFVKQWINRKGCLFLIVLGSVFAIGAYFVQTSTVKNLIQQELSAQWGAPIEVDRVSLSLSPIGFTVNGLALTGLKDANKKAFSADNLSVHVNLYHLVVGRVVFDDMQISKIRINVDEFSPNLTDEEKQSEEESVDISLPTLPTVEDILGEGQFKTDEKTKQLQAAIKQASSHAEKLQTAVPSQQQYQDYQQRIQQLRTEKINLQSAPQALEKVAKLKVELSVDLEKFNQARNALQKDVDNVSTIMRELPQAPEEDWQRIRHQYKINIANTGNLMTLLLGEKVSKWVKNGQLAYHYAKPYIDSYQANQTSDKKPEINHFEFGRYISFKENDPQPNFNIRQFLAQASDDSWKITMQNINIEHASSQLASTGTITLNEPNAQPKTVNITIDHRSSSAIVNQLDFDSGEQTVTNETLLDNSNLSMIIQQATQQESLKINLQEDAKITGFWQQNYSSIHWDNEKMNKAKGNAMRPGVFDKIVDFKSRVNLGGKITSPEVGFTSNLDNRLRTILEEAMQETLDSTKQAVKDKLNEKASKILEKGRQSIVALTQQKKQLEKTKKTWEKQLDQKLTEYQEDVKKQATSQVKKKAEKTVKELKDKLLNEFKLN